MTDCWMLGEFSDLKQARTVCGLGLLPLTTERRSLCRNVAIALIEQVLSAIAFLNS